MIKMGGNLLYEDRLLETLKKSKSMSSVLRALMLLDPPFEYYVGAGSVTNTIWNEISGYPLEYGISDIDIEYYDKYNLDVHHETKLKKELERILGDFSFKLDVKNQARVHFWYESKFGFPIKPYMSIEKAIDSWPTTATAIGVRLEHNGLYTIYSPYGLNDLFSMVVRPNKLLVTQEIYESKSTKWKEKWPLLEIIPW